MLEIAQDKKFIWQQKQKRGVKNKLELGTVEEERRETKNGLDS